MQADQGQGQPPPLKPLPARRATPAPRGSGLTLGKLVLGTVALLLLAYFIGNQRSRKTASPESDVVAAQNVAMPERAARPAATVIQGEKSTTLSEVDEASMQVIEQGRVLRVEGGVGKAFATDLQAMLDANPGLQRIDITSGGGYANPGLEAARMIRRRNLVVRVQSHCASMCVALWAAGAQRQLEPDAVIGLHAWNAQCEVMPSPQREECRYQIQFATAHDSSYSAWLRGAGFNKYLMDLQTRTAAEDIAVLRAPQLWDNGVDFSVVDGNGARMSRAAVEQYLARR